MISASITDPGDNNSRSVFAGDDAIVTVTVSVDVVAPAAVDTLKELVQKANDIAMMPWPGPVPVPPVAGTILP